MTEPLPLEERARLSAQQFNAAAGAVQRLGNGLINDTFLVSAAGSPRFVLQRINSRVFRDPAAILHNLRTIQEHLSGRGLRRGEPDGALILPRLIPTRDGADYLVDSEGEWWRAQEYIENTETVEAIDVPERAEQVGRGLGRFHRLFEDLDAEELRDTLPGFHVTPDYLQQFRKVFEGIELRRAREIRMWEEFIGMRTAAAGVLERAREQGRVAVRVVHGDPKLNNFLFRRDDHRVVGLIDLDTVRPGLIHHDLGDCLRSCCNTAGEDGVLGGPVSFDLGIAEAILRGYLAEARGLLSATELALIGATSWLIPFELGVRFLTDYLCGNLYFKVANPQQNLHRALVQFRLTESIEQVSPQIEQLVDEIAGR